MEATVSERERLMADQTIVLQAERVTKLIDERDRLREDQARLMNAMRLAYNYIDVHRHGKAKAVLFAALKPATMQAAGGGE